MFTINGQTLEIYFTTPSRRWSSPSRSPSPTPARRYDVNATIHGGGISGQAGALRMAIARSLLEIDPETRPVLKKAGLLTRDSRKKESKKYGLKKARKAPQFTKR